MVAALAALALFGIVVFLATRKRPPGPARTLTREKTEEALPPPFTGPPGARKESWTREDLITLIRQISEEEGFGPSAHVALAIAEIESGFNASAVNPQDPSFGIMQLQFSTARAYVPWITHADDLLSPHVNIRAGVRFLKDLSRKHLSQYGLDGVIQMYNLGETRFIAGARVPAYLVRVRSAMDRHRR